MKTCPYCAEQIQDMAKYCRYCKKRVSGILFRRVLKITLILIIVSIVLSFWIYMGKTIYDALHDFDNIWKTLKDIMKDFKEGIGYLKNFNRT